MEKRKERLISFRNCVFDVSEKVFNWAKEYKALLLIYLGIGIIVYFMLMSQNLINSGDGLAVFSSHSAGRTEMSSARWFLPYVDKFRFGINSSSLNSFVSLLLIACGNIFIVDLFQIRDKLIAALAGALFIVTPTVCATLTFSYTSVGYAVAYLLSILSAYSTLKIPEKKLAVIAGGWFMACSMGCYQAYFGVTCIILLIYFIKELFWDADKNIVRNIILKGSATVLVGGFFYKCMVTLVNAIHHVHLSNYKDVNNISLRSIIVNLPRRIPEAYKEFFQFYFTNARQRMTFGLKGVFIAAFLITLCLFLYKMKDMTRRNKQNAILSVLAILFVPLASNATLILITTSNVILMTAGTAILFSLFLCLFDGFFKKKLLYSCYLCVLIVLCWVNICIVNNDQIAIRDGRTATVAIAQNVVTRLLDEGYIDSENKFVFWGRPSANRMFFETTPLKKANGYAKFGTFGTGVWSNRAHWNGLFSAYCGIKFNFRSDEQYKELLTNEKIKEMPCFPDRKSIQKIDGVVVVKVSDIN